MVRRVGSTGTWEVSDFPLRRQTVRAPFNQVAQVVGMTCSAERSEERTNAMVRAPVKGARMRSEKSESSRSTDDVGERTERSRRREGEDRVKVLEEG
jgi:hypothetical protein